MTKKRPEDDLKGFEEFIEAESDKSFLGKPTGGQKRENNFENFNLLANDAERLTKVKNLLSQKLPFATTYSQGKQIMRAQREEIQDLKRRIFVLSDKPRSPYRKSLSLIFDTYFKPPQS